MLDGWKLTLGSILAAIGIAVQSIDFSKDSVQSIVGKLLLALAAGLVGAGAAGKADKMIAAMAKPVEVISATPEARAALITAPTATDKPQQPSVEEQAALDAAVKIRAKYKLGA